MTALAQYDLDVRSVEFLGAFTNVLFRVRSPSGVSYVLRICRPGWRTLTDILSETAWLRALSRETEIPVPEPLPARDGKYVVRAKASGVPESRHCVLMRWLPGVLLGKRLTEANLVKMGTLFAGLHAHAAGFTPPEQFTRRKMNSIDARGEQGILFSASCAQAFTPRTRVIFTHTMECVDKTVGRLYADPQGLRVIHNDLHHDNIKVHRGRLHPLDFEDTIWGYPTQDIAMALQDLMVDVERDVFEPLQRAFRQGYETVASWPEREMDEIDTLRAGRMIWVTNYVAQCEAEYLERHIHRVAPIFEAFLETGRLRKPSP
jgi:Ser/Thr protein kinase RdoA (MazF antagonist)